MFTFPFFFPHLPDTTFIFLGPRDTVYLKWLLLEAPVDKALASSNGSYFFACLASISPKEVCFTLTNLMIIFIDGKVENNIGIEKFSFLILIWSLFYT